MRVNKENNMNEINNKSKLRKWVRGEGVGMREQTLENTGKYWKILEQCWNNAGILGGKQMGEKLRASGISIVDVHHERWASWKIYRLAGKTRERVSMDNTWQARK